MDTDSEDEDAGSAAVVAGARKKTSGRKRSSVEPADFSDSGVPTSPTSPSNTFTSFASSSSLPDAPPSFNTSLNGSQAQSPGTPVSINFSVSAVAAWEVPQEKPILEAEENEDEIFGFDKPPSYSFDAPAGHSNESKLVLCDDVTAVCPDIVHLLPRSVQQGKKQGNHTHKVQARKLKIIPALLPHKIMHLSFDVTSFSEAGSCDCRTLSFKRCACSGSAKKPFAAAGQLIICKL